MTDKSIAQTQSTQPLRFYCFIRESSPGQKDKYGPKAQWRDFEKFSLQWPGGPHPISEQFSATIIESATKWERPAWEQAIIKGITAFRQGLIDAFLFGRVDRETRNLFPSIPILRMAMNAGVPIFFAQEKFRLDPKDPDSMDKYFKEAQDASAYARKLVKNTTPGRIARAREDQKHPTNTKMFCFDLVDGKRIPNQAQGEAIRQAAQVALRAGRAGPAAKWLNERGWRTTHEEKFSAETLGGKRGLFRNRALIGQTLIHFRDEPEPVIVWHERILDDATFEALQVMLDGRRLRGPRSEAFYCLSGVTFCGCGARFEPTKSGSNRYYRCKARCGERYYQKDRLEWEVYEAFIRYLRQKENRQEYLELAQRSKAGLQQKSAQVERGLGENMRDWQVLLKKDLADYPDILINEEKRKLKAERESLLQAKSGIERELAALPEVDPAEVEAALSELAKPFESCRYGVSDPEMWRPVNLRSHLFERASVREALEGSKDEGFLGRSIKFIAALVPKKLTDEQTHLLRETLLKLNCRVVVKNHALVLTGKLSLGVGLSEAVPGAS